MQIRRVIAAYEEAIATPIDPVDESSVYREVVFDDLQPEFLTDQASDQNQVSQTYQKIEDVPDQGICEISVRVLTKVGTVDWNDLLTQIARELGFGRTGRKIRERLESVLQQQIRNSTIHRDGDRVMLH